MGLLHTGEPLSWEEIKKLSDQLRRHGAKQFVYQFNKLKQVEGDDSLWGDELECTLIRFDHEQQMVYIKFFSL